MGGVKATTASCKEKADSLFPHSVCCRYYGVHACVRACVRACVIIAHTRVTWCTPARKAFHVIEFHTKGDQLDYAWILTIHPTIRLTRS